MSGDVALPGLDTQLSGLRERHGPKLDVATSHQEPAENVSLLTSANQICSYEPVLIKPAL